MAEQVLDPRKDSRFQEQIPDNDKAPSTNQQVPAGSDPTPYPHGATPGPRQSPERAGQTPSGDSQASPANTSSAVPVADSGLECPVCGRVFCICPPSVRAARSNPPPVDPSWTLTQALSSVPSASQTDENVSPTDNRHVKFAKRIDNKADLIGNEEPQTVMTMDSSSAEAQYTAAQRRSNRARVLLEAARTRSVDAHVALRAAETNAGANPSQQANDAVEVARYDASVADDAHREAQTEAVSAHAAALSNANLHTRHAAVTHANEIPEQTAAKQESHSDVKRLPSQKDPNREENDPSRWKGKGRAEKSDDPSSDKKQSLSSVSSLYQQPIDAVKRILHIGDFNEQYPQQTLERSESLPSRKPLPSPNPLHKARVEQPPSRVTRDIFGVPHLRKPEKDKPTTTTGRPMSCHLDGGQMDTTGGVSIPNKDGTGDDNASNSQPTKDEDAQKTTGSGSGPVNQNDGGGSKDGGKEKPPKQDEEDETGKKQGTLRKASSKLWDKLKRKK